MKRTHLIPKCYSKQLTEDISYLPKETIASKRPYLNLSSIDVIFSLSFLLFCLFLKWCSITFGLTGLIIKIVTVKIYNHLPGLSKYAVQQVFKFCIFFFWSWWSSIKKKKRWISVNWWKMIMFIDLFLTYRKYRKQILNLKQIAFVRD